MDMITKKILEVAREAYPGQDPEDSIPLNKNEADYLAKEGGDTLALFIYREIRDVADGHDDDDLAVLDTIDSMNKASKELFDVAEALRKLVE